MNRIYFAAATMATCVAPSRGRPVLEDAVLDELVALGVYDARLGSPTRARHSPSSLIHRSDALAGPPLLHCLVLVDTDSLVGVPGSDWYRRTLTDLDAEPLMAYLQRTDVLELAEAFDVPPREVAWVHYSRYNWREADRGVWEPLRAVTAEPEVEPDPVEVAAAAFAHALRAQRGAAALGVEEAAALGARAAELVGGGLEWYEHVGEVVDVHQAQAVLRVGSRQAVYDLVKRNRLLGLRRSGGAMAIPMFQIDPATGRPYRAMPLALAEFAAADVDPYTVASWFNTPQLDLGGDTPAAAIRLPARDDAVRACAEAAAARWAE